MQNDEQSHRIIQCEDRLEKLEAAINGNGHLGISQKVTFMWRTGIGLLYSVSAGAGIMVTAWLQHLIVRMFK